MKDQVDDRFVEFQEGFAVLDHVENTLIAIQLELELPGFMVFKLLVKFFRLESQLAQLILQHDFFSDPEAYSIMGWLRIPLVGVGCVIVIVIVVIVVLGVKGLDDCCCCCGGL